MASQRITHAYEILSDEGHEVDQLNTTTLAISGISDDEAERLFLYDGVLSQLQWFTTDTGDHLLIDLSA